GAGYLIRPEALFVAVPIGIAILIGGVGRPVPRPWTAGGRTLLARHARHAVPRLVLFAVPILLCAAPYAAYLHSHTGRWELSAKAQAASIDAWLYGAKDQRALRDKQIWSLDDQGNLAVPTGTSLAQLARAHPREYGSVMAANIRHMAGYLAAPEAGKVASWLLLPLPVWA